MPMDFPNPDPLIVILTLTIADMGARFPQSQVTPRVQIVKSM